MSAEPTIAELQRELEGAKDYADNLERGMSGLRAELAAAKAEQKTHVCFDRVLLQLWINDLLFVRDGSPLLFDDARLKLEAIIVEIRRRLTPEMMQ